MVFELQVDVFNHAATCEETNSLGKPAMVERPVQYSCIAPYLNVFLGVLWNLTFATPSWLV